MIDDDDPVGPFAYQSIGGAAVFYPGYIYVEEPPPLEEKRRRCCPRCGYRASTADRTGNAASHYVFRCSRCITAEGPTTWREEKGA